MQLVHHKGNLFSCPNYVHLVHCVSKDGRMGAGIARQFQSIFNLRQEFLNSFRNVGDAVVLWREPRHIVNLVTKEEYFHLPTVEDLECTLYALKSFVIDNHISCIAMPEISAGLDKVPLNVVIHLLWKVFNDVPIRIHMYHW